MATVANLAEPGPLDPTLCQPTRNIAGSPIGVTTRAFPGEIITDTTNNMNWLSYGPATSQWTPVFLEV